MTVREVGHLVFYLPTSFSHTMNKIDSETVPLILILFIIDVALMTASFCSNQRPHHFLYYFLAYLEISTGKQAIVRWFCLGIQTLILE